MSGLCKSYFSDPRLTWKWNIFYLITVTSGSQNDGHDETQVEDWQDSGQSVEQEFGSIKYWGLRVVLVFDWPTAVEGIDASQLSAAHNGPGLT